MPDPRWLVSPVLWLLCSSPGCEAPVAWPWWRREGPAERIPGNGSMTRSPLCVLGNIGRPVCGWWTSGAPSRVERLWNETAGTQSKGMISAGVNGFCSWNQKCTFWSMNVHTDYKWNPLYIKSIWLTTFVHFLILVAQPYGVSVAKVIIELSPFTVFIHVHFQALFQTARSALVSVSFVDGTATLHGEKETRYSLQLNSFQLSRQKSSCYSLPGRPISRWKIALLSCSYRPAPLRLQCGLIPGG